MYIYIRVELEPDSNWAMYFGNKDKRVRFPIMSESPMKKSSITQLVKNDFGAAVNSLAFHDLTLSVG